MPMVPMGMQQQSGLKCSILSSPSCQAPSQTIHRAQKEALLAFWNLFDPLRWRIISTWQKSSYPAPDISFSRTIYIVLVFWNDCAKATDSLP